MSLATASAFIRKWEGGAYHPTTGAFDPNKTMWGVTENTYHAAGYPGSVYDITESQWNTIFLLRFWRKAGCHLYLEPLDIVVADPAYNSGPKQAVKFVQRGVQVTPDGIFGPRTLAAVQLACATPKGVLDLCVRVQGQRIRFLRDLYAKSQARVADWDGTGDQPHLAPIDGWMARVHDLGRVAGLY